MKKSYEPEVIAVSGVTDPYQPVERAAHHARLPRGAGGVPQPGGHHHEEPPRHAGHRRAVRSWRRAHDARREPVHHDAGREAAARHGAAHVDPEAAAAAIEKLAAAGIPVGIMVAPIVPGITDEEMGDILQAARDAGASGPAT
jgi:hypothetical protein